VLVVLLVLAVFWLLLWFLPGAYVVGFDLWNRCRGSRVTLGPDELKSAESRARALLCELLDEREYDQLMRQGYLEVASPNHEERTYRIPCNTGRVRVYEHGEARVDLCVQPVISLPASDVIVLHKLMIQGNEEGYLARANEVPLPLPPAFYGWNVGHWFDN
jgi:hypothetical protein